MNIPGAPARHAIVTDECRQNRGDEGAFEEAVARLRQSYEGACTGWGRDKGVRLHLVLAVERPTASGLVSEAKDEAAVLREHRENLFIEEVRRAGAEVATLREEVTRLKAMVEARETTIDEAYSSVALAEHRIKATAEQVRWAASRAQEILNDNDPQDGGTDRRRVFRTNSDGDVALVRLKKIAALAPPTDERPDDLPARVLAMCEARGWGLNWHERSSVLFCEVAELTEAYRGKRGSVREEAADVLISTAALVGGAGVSWTSVLDAANEKVARFTTMEHYDADAPKPTPAERG